MQPYEFLKQELDRAVKQLRDDSDKHKRLHRHLSYATFVLTALSTVLASAGAFSERYREYMLLAVIATTAVAGLVTSVESLRKPGELWIHERRTHYELVDLRRELLFIAPNATESQLAQLFNRMQAILSVSAASWSKLNPGDEAASTVVPQALTSPRLMVKRSEPPAADHRT